MARAKGNRTCTRTGLFVFNRTLQFGLRGEIRKFRFSAVQTRAKRRGWLETMTGNDRPDAVLERKITKISEIDSASLHLVFESVDQC